MKFTCKTLGDKSFETKEAMFLELKNSKDAIIALKKSAIKDSDAIPHFRKDSNSATKESSKNPIEFGSYIYPVINTTNYLDSHDDVHFPGIWDKSIEAQQGKTYLIINHNLSLGNVISYPKDVQPMVKMIPWSELGKSYEGETQALIFKSKLTEKSNRDAFLAYRDGEDIQHSIRMQYVKIELAINDVNPQYKAEKAIWDKYIDQIANKEDAEAQGFFWAILEAKIYKEGSAVLFGSNDATPTLYDIENKTHQPPTSTGEAKNDPPTSNLSIYQMINKNF